MTTADMPWRQGKNPRFDYIATRLAHWTPALFVLAATWSSAIPSIVPVNQGWALALGMAVMLALPTGIVVILGIMTHNWHLYAICPVCARKMPLDPAAEVAAKRRPLRTLHWIAEKHPKANERGQIALLIASWLPWIGRVAFPTLLCWVAFTLYLGNVHMRLQPWCPQCHWDDGGHEEFVPESDPVGADEKVS